MRWIQESSDATPCGKHRAQVLDSLRLWCQTSLPEAFRDPEMFHPFGTISEQFLRDLFTCKSYMSEHCPSFEKLCELPLSFNRSMVSIIRNPASGTTWNNLFNRNEARDLSMTSDWGCSWTTAPPHQCSCAEVRTSRPEGRTSSPEIRTSRRRLASRLTLTCQRQRHESAPLHGFHQQLMSTFDFLRGVPTQLGSHIP